jgi:hypothetical protein
MLATFGLERLESSLDRDTVQANDVAEFLEHAESGDVSTLARDGMPEALDCFHRRRMKHTEQSMEAVLKRANYPGLYSRAYGHSRANPQFQPTRHADSV